MTNVAVLGASGYVGGELLRLLYSHPDIKTIQAVSERYAGKQLGSVHPHLRAISDIRFVSRKEYISSDIQFLAMPHGGSSANTKSWLGKAAVTIDLSADFRLKDIDLYEHYYGEEHKAPELSKDFVPGIPEIYRDDIRNSNCIAVPGCNALAGVLALHPLKKSNIIETSVFIDTKVGSSGAGTQVSLSNHHSVRSGGVRVFKPTGHRHEAEIISHCKLTPYITVNSVDMVRGILLTAFCRLNKNVQEKDIRAVYREAYSNEPFTRLVKLKRQGIFSMPEPKILSGTNYCDVGFHLSSDGKALIAISALDNLTKGAAGNAIHCMNINMQIPEHSGLDYINQFPI